MNIYNQDQNLFKKTSAKKGKKYGSELNSQEQPEALSIAQAIQQKEKNFANLMKEDDILFDVDNIDVQVKTPESENTEGFKAKGGFYLPFNQKVDTSIIEEQESKQVENEQEDFMAVGKIENNQFRPIGAKTANIGTFEEEKAQPNQQQVTAFEFKENFEQMFQFKKEDELQVNLQENQNIYQFQKDLDQQQSNLNKNLNQFKFEDQQAFKQEPSKYGLPQQEIQKEVLQDPINQLSPNQEFKFKESNIQQNQDQKIKEQPNTIQIQQEQYFMQMNQQFIFQEPQKFDQDIKDVKQDKSIIQQQEKKEENVLNQNNPFAEIKKQGQKTQQTQEMNIQREEFDFDIFVDQQPVNVKKQQNEQLNQQFDYQEELFSDLTDAKQFDSSKKIKIPSNLEYQQEDKKLNLTGVLAQQQIEIKQEKKEEKKQPQQESLIQKTQSQKSPQQEDFLFDLDFQNQEFKLDFGLQKQQFTPIIEQSKSNQQKKELQQNFQEDLFQFEEDKNKKKASNLQVKDIYHDAESAFQDF